jgi:GT2 family glycosyltransferase
MINIYMTSFFRYDFTLESIKKIHERTEPGTFQIHVYDNASDPETQDKLYGLLKEQRIMSLTLDSRNTGCLYNKLVFHAMTETKEPYYVVTDNDIFAPALSPSWLAQMVEIMDRHPEIAFLTPQLPPQNLMEPYKVLDDIIYCKAVGNALKLVRRKAFPVETEQVLGAYGDDGNVSKRAMDNGYKNAFCRNIFCYHAGQCKNWGYEEKEIYKDPRKVGYGKPFEYNLKNNETYEPMPQWKI